MTQLPPSNDSQYVQAQYQTDHFLETRIRTHQLYSQPKVDFQNWVLDLLEWQGDELVLDVGCGSGSYVDAVQTRSDRYVAGDLSYGMLQALAASDLARLNLDAQHIPLRGGAVDVLLANHMLYHVPDLHLTLAEFARVLRPGGCLLAATNSSTSMRELRELIWRAFEQIAPGADEALQQVLLDAPESSFNLENGKRLLEAYFPYVEQADLAGVLVFPAAQPVIEYIASMGERYLSLTAGLNWTDLESALKELIEAEIARQGAFRVSKLSGAFICRNAG